MKKKKDIKIPCCPLRKFKPCLGFGCAFYISSPPDENGTQAVECSIRALGYIDYSLQAIANLIDSSNHIVKASMEKKGRRK